MAIFISPLVGTAYVALLAAIVGLSYAVYKSIDIIVLKGVHPKEIVRDVSILAAIAIIVLSPTTIMNATVLLPAGANTTAYTIKDDTTSTIYIVEYWYNTTTLYNVTLPTEKSLADSIFATAFWLLAISIAYYALVATVFVIFRIL